MRKIILIPVIAVLVLGLVLSACSSPSSTTTPSATSQPTTTPSATGQPTTTPSATSQPTTTPSATSQPTSSPKYGGTFKFIDVRSPTSTLGWYAESGAMATMATPPILESLINIDSNANIHGALATDWEVAPDLKSITFTLRKGVKFHDGSDFNAEVAKWNFDQYIAAEVAGVDKISSVDVIDNYTLRINLKTWENPIMDNINSIFIVSKQAFDEHGQEWIRWNPVGTGPFKFVSFERDVSVKYERFDDYWQEGRPYLDAIVIYFVSDPMTMSASLRAGEVDAIGRDLARAEYDLMQTGNYYLQKTFTGALCLYPDSKNSDSPFSNFKVRLAVDYAIDRDAIVGTLGLGFQEAVHQASVPGNPAYINDLPPRDYNPEKAKQLLAEAGYPDGFNTLLLAHNICTDKQEMEAVQGYLNKAGIIADMQWVDHATFNKSRMGGWENALLASMVVVGTNASVGAKTYLSQTGVHYPSLDKTDEMENLLEDARLSPTYDPELMKKYIRYIYDNAVIIPLWAPPRGDVIQPYVHDTGFYSLSGWTEWTPADTWLSK
jgi:peptide/nickel transport system substrate-binding protein